MIFNYQAINAQGIESSGQKQAENQELLLISLREQGLYPVTITAVVDSDDEALADNDIRLQLQQLQAFGVAKKVFIFRQLALSSTTRRFNPFSFAPISLFGVSCDCVE